ncbi:MAG: hypothetical protein ABEH83_11060 [Halobacterium sp.]
MRRDRRTQTEENRVATETADGDASVRRLDCRVEDDEDGRRATLFPVDAEGDELVTHWLTADESDFVALADCR